MSINSLKQSTHEYSPLNGDVVEEYNRERKLGPKPVLCYAPTKSMRFDRDGRVFACCYNNKHDLGHYPEETIAEIWKGHRIKELRERLENNDLTSGCHICKVDFENKLYKSVKTSMYDYFPLNKDYPTMLEFKLENTCNLECEMCFGISSSLIRKNRDKLPPLHGPYDDAFVDQLEGFIPYLSDARFSGGEPFLIDIYYKIWDKILEINPDCTIMVQTNGTVLNNKIKNMLQKGKFRFSISLTSVKNDNYQKIRKNSSFEESMSNIKFFREYCDQKGTYLGITITPMKQNWRELPEFIEICNDLDTNAWFNIVYAPPKYALWAMTSNELKEIYNELSASKSELTESSDVQIQNKEHYCEFLDLLTEWHENALKREGEVSDEKVEISLFKGFLHERVEMFINGNCHASPEEKEERRKRFATKIDNVHTSVSGIKISKSSIRFLNDMFSEELLLELFEHEPEQSICDDILVLSQEPN